MRKWLLFVFLLLLSCFVFSISDGDGSPQNPFVIMDCNSLQEIEKDLSASYVLGQNINCYITGPFDGRLILHAIAPDPNNGFRGHFDGKYYVISDLMLGFYDQNEYGNLFGTIAYGGVVENVAFYQATVRAGDQELFGSGVVAQNNYGTIRNIFVNGSFSNASIVGSNSGLIENCFGAGSIIDAGAFFGGIAGLNFGTIKNCFFVSNEGAGKTLFASERDGIYGGESVGGIVGSNNGLVENCYFVGEIKGGIYVGGLVGNNYDSGDKVGEIRNSFADVNINPLYGYYPISDFNEYFGLITSHNEGLIENTYFINRGTDLNVKNNFAQAKEYTATNYSKNNPPFSSWDFEKVWKETSTLPRLQIEEKFASLDFEYFFNKAAYSSALDEFGPFAFDEGIYKPVDYGYGWDFGFGKVGFFFFLSIIFGFIYLLFWLRGIGDLGRQEKFSIFSPTLGSLLVSNLLAIDFALAYNWQVGEVMLLYWFQSVIIGLFYFLKILTLRDFKVDGFSINDVPATATKVTQVFTALFFAVHYGFFHFGYLVFIGFFGIVQLFMSGNLFVFLIMVVVFFINHLFSFMYFFEHERAGKNIGTIMFTPYARIFPMHLFICLGMFLVSGPIGITLFLLLKTGADVVMHFSEHSKTRLS